MRNNFLSMEALEDRLRYWQSKLRLMDWQVEIMFERGYNLGADIGRIHIFEDKRRALIRMTEANDWDPANLLPYDMEQVVVHELLHIHFYPLTRDAGSNVTAEEQAIEAISWALVSLDRRADEVENYYLQELERRPYGLLPRPAVVNCYAGRGEGGTHDNT
ncbi:hypothetical protein [Paenibacillus sp. BK720]|uniref:hypothetical protein n=1 Tax=Paenibacillus sp. BK720 TaxID=2587092 RepID=UPI001424810F|nr:hypothetical protein [Paenibacillus sp. BK720]NIK67915.1 hypothetical protein [Paenibacillus sp. BK720]